MNKAKSLTIATWNLDQPRRGWKNRKPLIEKQIQQINADIWVLTETDNNVINLSPDYQGISSQPYPDGFTSATIWFKSSILIKEVLPTLESKVSACVALDLSVDTLIVYGTIIPYNFYKGESGTSKQWEEHYKSIEICGSDWSRLQQQYPNYRFCVAGDFNQVRDGSRWYGTHQGRDLLTQQLNLNHLVCVTEEDMVANGKLKERHNIDHICLSQNWVRETYVTAWEGTTADGIYLSDHNGISVELYF